MAKRRISYGKSGKTECSWGQYFSGGLGSGSVDDAFALDFVLYAVGVRNVPITPSQTHGLAAFAQTCCVFRDLTPDEQIQFNLQTEQ